MAGSAKAELHAVLERWLDVLGAAERVGVGAERGWWQGQGQGSGQGQGQGQRAGRERPEQGPGPRARPQSRQGQGQGQGQAVRHVTQHVCSGSRAAEHVLRGAAMAKAGARSVHLVPGRPFLVGNRAG
eukprot:1517891-Rhodomonas_salina.1